MGFAGLLQILKTDKGLQIFREYVEGFLAFPQIRGAPFRFRKETHRRRGPRRRHLLVHAQPLARADRHRLHHRAGAFGGQRFGRRAGVVDSHPAAAVLRSRPAAPPGRGAGRGLGRAVRTRSGTTSCGPSPWAPCWWARATRCSRCAARSSQSIAGAFGASAKAAHEGRHLERTDRDIPFQWLALGTAVLVVAVTIIYYILHGELAGGHCCRRHHDGGGFPALRRGRIPGGAGGQLQPAALRADAFGAGALRAGDAGHRRQGDERRGGGAGRGQRGGLRLLGLRVADSGSEGRPPAGRHALEDAGGGDRRPSSCSRCS